MKISSITNNILTPKVTGYSSAAGIGLTLISGTAKTKAIKKMHKPLAYTATVLTLLHIGLIEYNHYKYKKNQTPSK